MAQPRKQVPAKPQGTAVAEPLIDMSQDSGAGFEGATKDSFAIPFLAILQSLSPQCKKSDGAYIKGAEEGMIFNTASQEIFDGEEGILYIPSAYTLTFVEWGLREKGGGFKGEHSSSVGPALLRSCHKDDRGRDILPNGNQLNATHNFYGLLLTDEGVQRAVISMTSTQIKTAKKWMTTMNMQTAKRADGSSFTPPMFANVYRLTTAAQSNEKGSWSGWSPALERALDTSDQADVELYLAARAFKEAIVAGEVKTEARNDETAGGSVEPVDGEDF